MKSEKTVLHRRNAGTAAPPGIGLLNLWLLCAAMAALSVVPPGFLSPASGSALDDGDCVKCHDVQVADVEKSGASHRDIGCSTCHDGHPPGSRSVIPRCRSCHDGGSHFSSDSCSTCHRKGHAPLRIVMPDDSSDPCRECHPSAVALIDRGASLHSGMTCSECHETHRLLPSCRDCHEPHSEDPRGPACGECHNPHLPMPVVFSLTMADSGCAPCHREAFDLIRSNTTGHALRTCVSCHKSRHRSLPECSTCHGLPHRLSETALFDECGKCHITAHQLTVWPVENR